MAVGLRRPALAFALLLCAWARAAEPLALSCNRPPRDGGACSPWFGQCGGAGWRGATCCATGSHCTGDSKYYRHCAPDPPSNACAAVWGQCGGEGWKGPTCCDAGSKCERGVVDGKVNRFYSQCVPRHDAHGRSVAETAPHAPNLQVHLRRQRRRVALHALAAPRRGGARPGAALERGADGGADRAQMIALNNTFVELGVYLAYVSAGTPPQTFPVIYDTGSSATWITGFNAKRSSSFSNMHSTMTLSYGSGDIFVRAVEDTVGVPVLGAPARPLHVHAYRFGDALSVPQTVKDQGVRGIVGMAWPSVNTMHDDPLPLALVKSGAVAGGFSLWFNATKPRSDAEGYAELGGVATFGGADARLYTGPLRWVPLLRRDFWTVRLDAVERSGGGGGGGAPGRPWAAIVDSGTNIILGPAAPLRKLFAGTPVRPIDMGSLYFFVPEASVAALEPVVLRFGAPGGRGGGGGDLEFVLHPGDYIRWEAGLFRGYAADGVAMYMLDFVGADLSANGFDWVVGLPFLRKYYSVWDYSTAAVGFALANRAPDICA